MISRSLLIGLLVSVVCTSAAWADCLPRLKAPGDFPNTPTYWNKTDSGPILSGFLDLEGPSGLRWIEHGVDLSHYNEYVNYAELKRCGASFAVVKMDDLFESHRRQLHSIGLPIIPYAYLKATEGKVDFKLQPHNFSNGAKDLTESELNRLLKQAADLGKTKAEASLQQYKSKLPQDQRTFALSGMSGQFIVVDVEEIFKVPSSGTERKNYGRFYAAMLATWVGTVKAGLPDVHIMFYTFPSVYTDYLQFALPSDNSIIHGMPVWLANTNGRAGDFDLTSNKGLQRICLSASGGNKCIMHQYSHRATFGVTPTLTANPPRHIDVDRLFRVKELKDAVGTQYVRDE